MKIQLVTFAVIAAFASVTSGMKIPRIVHPDSLEHVVEARAIDASRHQNVDGAGESGKRDVEARAIDHPNIYDLEHSVARAIDPSRHQNINGAGESGKRDIETLAIDPSRHQNMNGAGESAKRDLEARANQNESVRGNEPR
ncbi:UNVERIFIED_CONTAM: hypothetical protein HDU68_003537 [Siphonaria sp. JEL0065]|nr:hypothetical protein HDU68_003537 [Siphonaria sp. JEL0065]